MKLINKSIVINYMGRVDEYFLIYLCHITALLSKWHPGPDILWFALYWVTCKHSDHMHTHTHMGAWTHIHTRILTHQPTLSICTHTTTQTLALLHIHTSIHTSIHTPSSTINTHNRLILDNSGFIRSSLWVLLHLSTDTMF